MSTSRFRLLARLSVANLRRHRWRWVLTVVGIALGISSFTGVLSISRSIMFAFEQSVLRIAGRAQFQVSNGTAGVDAAIIDQITALPEVGIASGTVQYDVMVPVLGRRLTIFGILFGADHTYREAQFGTGALQLPDSASFVVKTDSVALSERLLAERDWRLGSTVDVIGPKGPRTLTVRGTVESRGPLAIFDGDVAVMDSDAAQHAFGELDRFHWLDVVLAPGVDLETARAAVDRVVAGRGKVETPLGRGKRMEAMLGTLRWMLTACGTVAMLVGVFLIHHTVATAIRQRRDDLTKLRAIGATRRLIALALLTEAAVIGLVGSLLGVVGGIAFARIAARAFGDAIASMYVSLPPPAVRLTAGELTAAIVLGEVTALVAAALPCAALLRLRPRQALQAPRAGDSGPAWGFLVSALLLVAMGLAVVQLVETSGLAGGIGAVATFAGCVFVGMTLAIPAYVAILTPAFRGLLGLVWSRLGLWVWQQVRRYRFHTMTTMGALAAAVAFTIGLTTLLGSYRAAVAQWISQTLTADVFVNAGATVSLLAGPTVDAALQDEIGRLDGAMRVMPWRFVQIQYEDHPIIVQAAAREMIARWHPDVEMERPDEVIISDSLAERYGFRVGDTLSLPAPLAPLRVTVVAVRPDYLLDLGNLKIEWGLFAQYFGDQGANILFIDAVDPGTSLALKRRVEELAAGRYDVTVLTGGELRRMMDALIDQSFALTTALQALALLVTVLAMVSATSATILDRATDLATWRAIGLERRRLVRVLVGEAWIVGALAGGLGVAGGALIGDVLVRVVAPAVAGFRMTVSWPFAWMGGVVLLTALFASVAAAVVAHTQMPRAIAIAGLHR